MAQQFQIAVLGRARGPWRNSSADAMADAVRLELASWDGEAREWFLAVPVEMRARGKPEPSPRPPPYPYRQPRPREVWSADDIALLRKHVRDRATLGYTAGDLGRSRSAVLRKAKQLGLPIAR